MIFTDTFHFAYQSFHDISSHEPSLGSIGIVLTIWAKNATGKTRRERLSPYIGNNLSQHFAMFKAYWVGPSGQSHSQKQWA